MEDLFILIIIGVFISFLYSGGKNPIEYYEDQKRKESERQRLRDSRDSFIAEMKEQGSHLDLSEKYRNRSEWAIAKDFFLKSKEWKNIRKAVFETYGKRCLSCGSEYRLEVDHIEAMYMHPSRRLDFNNLQPLCRDCNSIKGTATIDYRSSRDNRSLDVDGLSDIDNIDEDDDLIEELVREFGLDDTADELAVKQTLLKKEKDYSSICEILLDSIEVNAFLDEHLLYTCRSLFNWTFISQNQNISWTPALIEKFESHLNWAYFTKNEGIVWSESFIDQHKDLLDWSALSGFFVSRACKENSFFWSATLINKYKDYIDWDMFSFNESILWSTTLIDEFKDRWTWLSLAQNPSFPWTLKIIDQYSDMINADIGAVFVIIDRVELPLLNSIFDRFRERPHGSWRVWRTLFSGCERLDWSDHFIETNKNIWDWPSLSKNKSLPWSEIFIDRYRDLWSWSGLSQNESLPWSEVFVDRYKTFWDWEKISKNKAIPFSEDFLVRYEELLNWGSISKAESISWSAAMIERHRDLIDWSSFSSNESLPFSETLLERYKHLWDWGRLSSRKSLPWSETILEQHKDFWNWSSISMNDSIPFSVSLIEKFKNMLDWEELSFRKSIPWSESLIDRYKDRWHWRSLTSNSAFPITEDIVRRYQDKLKVCQLTNRSELPWSVSYFKDHFNGFSEDDLPKRIIFFSPGERFDFLFENLTAHEVEEYLAFIVEHLDS